MSPPRSEPLLEPPRSDATHLESDRVAGIREFRAQRMKEPLQQYLTTFGDAHESFERLLVGTNDLLDLAGCGPSLLAEERMLEAMRYVASPPISLDDLKVLADAVSITRARLEAEPALGARIMETIALGVDIRRFPWLEARREPTATEREVAVVASAAMMATRRVETLRRNEGKAAQEDRVRQTLLAHDFRQVATRHVRTLAEAPGPGEFCMESELGTRKADLLVGLWDRRLLALECKVSNSATNSIKRLNNDAAVKAETWRRDFGTVSVVPAAVLSGVFKLRNLEDAQARGLTIFWAHDLRALTRWIGATRSS